MSRSTSAMALMPAPPMPTMWMRRSVPRSRVAAPSAGMGVNELGDAGGRVGVAVVPGGVAHGPEALGIAQEGIELEGEPPPVALVIGDVHRGAHGDERLGVARLVI